jgi:hypothetical protein
VAKTHALDRAAAEIDRQSFYFSNFRPFKVFFRHDIHDTEQLRNEHLSQHNMASTACTGTAMMHQL